MQGTRVRALVREDPTCRGAAEPVLWSPNSSLGTSLVAQWLRIRLSMQGTWVQSLTREDPTCHGATKPVHHNY
ncbi:hypothetical protein J1605_020444 [Eschrichtius robustus]|uniref:Uncharacterized protein n=1 Tax=Eschrichtius robustus TaxID=9764 RepID=A0AB34HKS1_ESCRO|nr:hypothetical protein J1605_020444 [Eschrichtius robustus]